jgi:hypothetical protein
MSIKATRKQRMTKSDVMKFVEWCFTDSIVEEIPKWSAGKIAEEYEKATNIKVSPQFVTLQRKKWIMENGKILNSYAPWEK